MVGCFELKRIWRLQAIIRTSDQSVTQADPADLGTDIIGFGSSKLNNFPAFPDRLRQGMLNTLVLAKMMKLGIFNRHPAFETPDEEGVFPGPSEEMYYYGISLGGIMGTFFSALTPTSPTAEST